MITIAYITDLHIDESNPAQLGTDTRRNWLLIYQDLIQRNVDLVVLGGDIGEGDGLPWMFNFMQGFAWHITPGNHDIPDILRGFYHNSELNDRHAFYFDYDHSGYRYLFLDTSSNSLDNTQLEWLEKKVLTDLPLIVFIHHPVLSVDTWVDAHYPLKNRSEVEDVLRKNQSQVTVFCGHYHLEHEQHSGNIRQLICPAASFQIVKNPDEFQPDISYTAYQLIIVNDDDIHREVIRIPV